MEKKYQIMGSAQGLDTDFLGMDEDFLTPAGAQVVDPYSQGAQVVDPGGQYGQASPRGRGPADTVAVDKLHQIQRAEAQQYAISGTDIVRPETFIITNQGSASTVGFVTLSANSANERSLVATFTIPTGFKLVFDPADEKQEVLFEPFTSAGTNDTNFIVGIFEVTLATPTLSQSWRNFITTTSYMRPGSNISSTGDRRKWQKAYRAGPGELVQFYFTSGSVLSTTNTNLAAGLTATHMVG